MRCKNFINLISVSLLVSWFKTQHELKVRSKSNVGLGNFGDFFVVLVICHHYVFEAQ